MFIINRHMDFGSSMLLNTAISFHMHSIVTNESDNPDFLAKYMLYLGIYCDKDALLL